MDPISSTVVSAGLSAAGDLYGQRKGYEYARKLRKTYYQDTMADMAKAGLNPILAGKIGGNSASVPESSLGTRAVNSALATKLQKKQIELLEKQKYKVTQEGNAAKQHAYSLQKDNWLKEFDNNLTALRGPGLRAVALMEGMSPNWLKAERFIKGAVGNSAKSIISRGGLRLMHGVK